MVAIVSGAGLGLLDSSANQLNGAGVLGSGALGQARGNGYVNLATGNLILQFTDETLSGSGADIRHLRTYNSLGTVGDGDNDRWRWLGEKRLTLSGTLNAAGSKVTRTTGDGHAAVYTWNAGRKAYVSAEGNGADDTIVRSGSEWVWTEGTSKVVERYNASTGWIKNSRDTSGNGFNYSFSGNLLTRISDAVSGQTLDLKYSSNRLVRVETRPTTSGAVTQQVHYSYDSSGRLSKVTTDLTLNNSISDGNTYVTTYTYDGSSTRVKSISQSDGTSVNYTYINSGGSYKVRTVTDQTGVTTFTYNSGNTQVKNGEGETTTYFYDSQQRLTRVNSHAVGGKTQSIQYAYDSKDNVIKVTDGKGKAITYTYDSRSNLTKEVDALGNTIERTYSNDRMVTETRFVGGEAQTTRLVYDSKGRLRYTISAEGNVSESRYNTRGQVVLSIKYTGTEYNVSGLAKTTTLSESQLNSWVSKANKTQTEVSKFDYNHRGQLIRQYDYGTVNSSGNGVLNANTIQTEFVYSAYGELLQTISVTGNDRKTKTKLESRTYDGMGRVLSVVNDKGTTTTSYANRKITVKQSASGLTVATAFDSRGKLINVTSSGSGVNRITRNYYDNAGRLVMTQNATGGRAYTIYDDAGRVSHRVSELGAVTGYLYDENGRVIETRQYQNKVNTSSWFSSNVVKQKSLSVSTHGSDRITRYAYDNGGRLVSTTEEFGSNDRVTTTAYDSASQVASTTISGVRTTRYFYDKDGRVVGTLNGENYLTENVYDNAGRLSTVIRYGNKSTVNNTLQAIKDKVKGSNIRSTHYFYDAQGREIGVLNEQGFLTETIYDVANRKTINQTYTKHFSSPNMSANANTQAELNRIKGIVGTSRHITTTNFDTRGRVSTVTNREGTKTRNIYDSAGRLSKTIVAEGTSDQTATRTRYNAFGEATGIVSGVGEAAQSNINTAIDQYGREYKYDLMGRKIVEEGPQGQKTFFYYDKEGRLTYTVNALGEVSHTTYTTFGEVATVTVLAGRISVSGLTGGSENSTLINRVNGARNGGKDQKVTNTYNQLGLIASSTNGEGKRTTYGYDKLGDLRDVYTPFSGSNTTRQHLVYDKLGRAIHSYANHDSIRAQTTTYFDGFGQVVRVNDANGKNHYTDYLDNGRTIRQRDPLGRQQTTTFDALGREVTMTDQNGQKTTYTYSNSSRSVIVTTPEGIQLTTWSTRTGQILQVRDGNGGITKYTYDKDGNLKTTTNPLGKVTTNTYDKSGRLYETKNANGHIVRYSYDAANRTVQEAIDPTGLNLRTHYTFDGIGQTIDVRKGHGTSAAQRTQFIYDRNGRVKQEIIDPTGLKLSTRYTYDDAGNQIKMERGTTASPAQQVVQYKYDELGRRTEEILDPAGLKLSTKFRYDKNGNLTRTINARGHSTWHIYNAANEKTYDVNALGQVVRYDYDAKGNLHHVREYTNKVSVSGWGDVRTSVGSLSTHGQDRRSYTIRDDDGRERFTLTTVDGSNWVATENVLDKNNNMIESRRFDRYVTNARVSTMVGSSSSQKGVITDAEMIAQLRATGYKARAWGDSTDTLISTRRTRFAYDKANRLRFTVDANGYLSENIYDNVGNVRFQTQFTLKPNSLGTNYSESYINSRKRTHSLDRKTEFRYDRANRLQYELSASVSVKASNNVVYAGQLKKRTHYDALGQVTKVEEGIIDRASGSDITLDRRTTSYQYDKAGNQIKTILAGWYDRGDQRIYQNQSGQSDRFQRTIEVKYDALGNAVRNKIRTGASTYVYQYKAYDAVGRELYDIDAEGYVSGKTYDAHGNVTAETRFNERKSGSLPSRGYWTAAEIASDMASDNSERIIRHTYNALGQKTRTLMPASGVNYTSSSSTSAKTPATLPNGTKYTAAPETRYEYNVFGEVVKQRVRVDKTRWADSYTYYDNIGRTVLTVDPLRYGTKTEYNALGNVTKTREYYNKGTGTVSVTAKPSFAGHSKDRVQLFSYDAMGRVTRVQQERVAAVTLNKSTLRYSGVSTGTKTIATNTYNAFGDIHTSKDGLNNETRYDYNALGLVTKVTEPSRKMASKQVDPFRSQVTTRPTTTFTYDVFGNVRSEVRTASSSALGGAIGLHKVYDHAGNLVRSTNGQGHHTDYRIDVNGRTVKQTQGVSVSSSQSKIAYSHTLETRYEYDKVGRQTTTLNVYSNSQSGTRHVYNAFGEVIREEKLRGSKNTATGSLTKATFKFYAYDAAGRVTYTRGTEGYTYFYYDLNNNVTRQEHRGTSNTTSGARVTEAYYDILGRATLQRLPYHTGTNNGARVDPKIRQSYDRWGNVLSRTDASNRTTTYTYNHTNQVTSERAPNVTTYRENNTAYTAYVTRTIDYDVAGRAAVEKHIARNTSGNAITTQKSSYQAYDEAGNVIRRVDATGKKTDFVYDIHNNKVGVRNGVGTVNVFDYDRNGNVIKQSLLRREDKVTTTTVNHQYGSYTNTTVTKLEYNGLVSSHTAKKKVQLNRFAYDQAGRRYAEFSSANKAEYYRYDQRGNIVLKQNVVGVQTRTTYDEFNNKTSEQQKVRLFSHNDRTEVTVPGGYGGSHTYFTNTPVYKDVWIGDNWEYSKSSYTFGRLTKRTYVIDAVTASNIKKNTFSYSYTRFNELYREASNANQFVQYAYWQNGLLRSKTDQQATNKKTTSTFHYDIRGLKTQEQHASNDTTSYTGYGGQVYTSNTNTNVKTIYSYDALGRLTKVVSPNGTFKTAAGTRSTANVKDLSYRYDEWGNRRAVIAKYRLTGSSSDRTTAYYYKYDAEGRVLVNEGMIASGKIVAGRYRGTAYTYDGAGRIATEEKWQYDLSPQYGSGGKTFFTRKKNTYNGFGLLESVAKATVTRAYNANSSASGSTGSYATIETYKYDNRGFRTESVINRAKTTTSYRDDGQVVAQTTRNSSNQITSVTQNYKYSSGGQLERYDFKHYDKGRYKFTNSYYYTYTGTYTGTQVKGISVTSTQKGTAKGVTNNYYDYRGRLVSSRITEANRKGDKTGFSYKYFAYNADDQIIGSHYKQYGESRPKVQSFIYHKNSPIADFGDNGVNITPIDSQYKAGGTPGSYTVKVGDTLTGIAQTLFGDSSLWYVLAEANALNIGPTDRFTQSDAGRTLRVPNTDQALRNNSTTFKPYNPTEIIGDLTPDAKILPPPKSKGGGCNIIATILIVVVAVVVTIFTAGAAAAALAPAGSALAGAGAWTAGLAVVGGGAIGGLSAGIAFAAGAIGGFVGSLASQAVGVGLGVQDGISLKQAFASGLTAGFSAGAGQYLRGASALTNGSKVVDGVTYASYNVQGVLASAAVSYAGGYISNKIVGLDTSFSWKGLAAQSIGALAGHGAGLGLEAAGVSNPLVAGTLSGFAGSATSATLNRKWNGGGRVNYAALAVDAFANQLASTAVGILKSLGQKKPINPPSAPQGASDNPARGRNPGPSANNESGPVAPGPNTPSADKSNVEIIQDELVKRNNQITTNDRIDGAQQAAINQSQDNKQGVVSASDAQSSQTPTSAQQSPAQAAEPGKVDLASGGTVGGPTKGAITDTDVRDRRYFRNPENGRFARNPIRDNALLRETQQADASGRQLRPGLSVKAEATLLESKTRIELLEDFDNLLVLESESAVKAVVKLNADSGEASFEVGTRSALVYASDKFTSDLGEVALDVSSNVDVGAEAGILYDQNGFKGQAKARAEAVLFQGSVHAKTREVDLFFFTAQVEGAADFNAIGIGGSVGASGALTPNSSRFTVEAGLTALIGARAQLGIKLNYNQQNIQNTINTFNAVKTTISNTYDTTVDYWSDAFDNLLR